MGAPSSEKVQVTNNIWLNAPRKDEIVITKECLMCRQQ